MTRSIFLACLLASALCIPAGAQQASRLLRMPDVSRTDIVFVYGGDIWTVPRAGGIARRLTAGSGPRSFPKFSPDGRTIAFTGSYDGNRDVYVMPAIGGEAKRLTYSSASELVLGWTPDGKSVLFRSDRRSFSSRFLRLFTVSTAGGMARMLPTLEAGLACFSPDGTKIAYNRAMREFATWKRYRGGDQAYISIYDIPNNRYSEVPHGDETDSFPMWRGDTIYFTSDRTGTANLFSWNLRSRQFKQLTRYADFDVEWPSLGPDAIVFQHGGAINLLDLATEKVTTVPIRAYGDVVTVRPALKHLESLITNFDISPSGEHGLFEAGGELFTAPVKGSDTHNVTNSPGVREMDPAWSPDGKSIAYMSDRTGEYELYVRPSDGTGGETQLTSGDPVLKYQPVWSPDSKALVYSDMALRLWMVTVADRKPMLVDTAAVSAIRSYSWSPDSKWVVYEKTYPNQLDRIVLYSVDKRQLVVVSDGRWNDRIPVFDPGGKYLFFLSDRNFTPASVGPEENIAFDNTTGIYLLTLESDTASPFVQESVAEGAKPEAAKSAAAGGVEKPAATKIDLDGLYSRIVTVPVPAGKYDSLAAAPGKLFFTGSDALHVFDIAAKSDTTIMSGVTTYAVNPAGTKLLYKAGSDVYGVIDPSGGQAAGAGKLTLSLEAISDPRAEWREIYWDAWREERDFYYDPKMHGLDWKAVGDRYAALLPDVVDRADLTYLLDEMIGELNTSHAYVFPPQSPDVKRIPVGVLGCDFEADQGYYRIKKIYSGRNWDPAQRAPLTEPGVRVSVGDYLISVNGVPAKTDLEPGAYFQDAVDRAVVLQVNSKPTPAGARDVKVRPISSDSETALRNLDWVEGNRRRVDEATGGRVGYIYVPDTSQAGITSFSEGFYSELEKEAVIVDERYNSGGKIPDFFTEKLARRLLSIGTLRYGIDERSPTAAIYGPKAMLANEWAGSGGDLFPYYFRKEQLGPIIGKRTWGGLVGINDERSLMDGGVVTAPGFGIWSPHDERWIAENHGIDPDIEVSNTPDLTSRGQDPQLERAIAYIQEQLRKSPPPKYVHPPFPVERRTGQRAGLQVYRSAG
jgi:tricorn protease